MSDVTPDRNWHEDKGHENGNYFCRCVHCCQQFVGHKRRVQCKKCHDAAKALWDLMTPEQQAEATRAQNEAIHLWIDRNVR